MSDWQVGDLAAYVKRECPICGWSKGDIGLEAGQVYTFIGYGLASCSSGRGLLLDGVPNDDAFGRPVGWCAADFRKIRPDEREACEPEFVTLLKRTKVSA